MCCSLAGIITKGAEPGMSVLGDTTAGHLARLSAAAYDALADEYYIRERHPTCGNFDVLQDALVSRLEVLCDGSDGVWLEVGCGRGRLDRVIAPERVILSDISPCMLALARRRTAGCVFSCLVDAFELPFAERSLRGVVAFLADPFNHTAFFSQSRRVLCGGGSLVFTLPNHDWANAVRMALRHPFDETHFIHRDGRRLRVPSLTCPIQEQCDRLRRRGFHIAAAYSVTLAECPEVIPSHHVALAARIMGCDPHDVPLVDVFVAVKDGRPETAVL